MSDDEFMRGFALTINAVYLPWLCYAWPQLMAGFTPWPLTGWRDA